MSPLERVLALYGDYQALDSAISLLNWDRQVLMPPGGAEARTEHVQRLTTMRYRALRSDAMARALDDLERTAEPNTDDAAIARALRRDLSTYQKLPLDLVQEKTRVSSDAYEAWKVAKATNDFAKLAPYLTRLFALAAETAHALGYRDHIYDPLIDLYEEGATYADARRMFDTIKQPIVDRVREIRERGRDVDDSLLYDEWDQARLRDFGAQTAARIGYDFRRGRLDIAPNAFCTNLSSSDVRMTTRPSAHIKGILSSTLHEMGHGLYEQGMPREWDASPLNGGISLAVHESQSRLWENIVGRARGFWVFFFPGLREAFPRLATLDAESFWRAFTKVDPTAIRVGSDELTYNLHILVRFELEVEILTRQLDVIDLPEAWNAKYTEYLGITPRNDSEGVLQDVHWSRGSVGYFPTYTMGNLIGGQIWKRLQADLGDTDRLMADGRFDAILGWLTENVYRQGRRFTPKQLVRKVTRHEMAADDWLAYAEAKYRQVYGLG